MDKISSFHTDSIKRIENKEIKKDDNASAKGNKTFTGDLSEQMAYLGAINRSNIKKPASSDEKKQILSDSGLSSCTKDKNLDLNKAISDGEKISLILQKAKSVNLDLDDNFIKQILAAKDISIEEIDKFIDACIKIQDSDGNCKFSAYNISGILEKSNIDINKITGLIEACSKVKDNQGNCIFGGYTLQDAINDENLNIDDFIANLEKITPCIEKTMSEFGNADGRAISGFLGRDDFNPDIYIANFEKIIPAILSAKEAGITMPDGSRILYMANADVNFDVLTKKINEIIPTVKQAKSAGIEIEFNSIIAALAFEDSDSDDFKNVLEKIIPDALQADNIVFKLNPQDIVKIANTKNIDLDGVKKFLSSAIKAQETGDTFAESDLLEILTKGDINLDSASKLVEICNKDLSDTGENSCIIKDIIGFDGIKRIIMTDGLDLDLTTENLQKNTASFLKKTNDAGVEFDSDDLVRIIKSGADLDKAGKVIDTCNSTFSSEQKSEYSLYSILSKQGLDLDKVSELIVEGSKLKNIDENCELKLSEINSMLTYKKNDKLDTIIYNVKNKMPEIILKAKQAGININSSNVTSILEHTELDLDKAISDLETKIPEIVQKAKDTYIDFSNYDYTRILCSGSDLEGANQTIDSILALDANGVRISKSEIENILSTKNVDLTKFADDLTKIAPCILKMKDELIEINDSTIRELLTKENFNADKFVSDFDTIMPGIIEAKNNGIDFDEDYSIIPILNNEDFDSEAFASNLNKLMPTIEKIQESGVEFYTSHLTELLKKITEKNYFLDDFINLANSYIKAKQNGAKYSSIKDRTGLGLTNGVECLINIMDVANGLNHLQSKLNAKNIIDEIKNTFETNNKSYTPDEIKTINDLSEKVNTSLEHTIQTTNVSKESVNKIFKGFFANNNTDLENTLKTADFTQYGTNGIPLEYTRANFIEDLNKILSNVSDTERSELLEKLDIQLTDDKNGYNGIISLNNLNDTDEIEGEVLEAATRFIKNNKVITGDSKLDDALNSLIAGMPEFINVIGKQQHGTHDLSVDLHLLTVLKESMADTNYDNLSPLDKTCLKFATILHDIAKIEGVEDENHPEASARYAKDILKKFNLHDTTKDRIYELIKNHHWLKAYNEGDENANYISTLFRRKDDYSIAKIMANADLKGVSKSWYEGHKNALRSENLKNIDNAFEKRNETGQIIFTGKVIKDWLIPNVEYNGTTYKVLDFSSMAADTDLEKYGMIPGTTPENLRLLVHMTDPDGLNAVKFLSDPQNDAALCASYVSLDSKVTLNMQKFGLSLESENANIITASQSDQSSSCDGLYSFARAVEIGKYRDEIPNHICEKLNLSHQEYAQLYDILMNKKYYTQIKDDDEINIGDKKLSGYSIKMAIQYANDALLNSIYNNEVILYTPKTNAVVAKVNNIEDIPQEYLDFANENNLPIYLLGE